MIGSMLSALMVKPGVAISLTRDHERDGEVKVRSEKRELVYNGDHVVIGVISAGSI